MQCRQFGASISIYDIMSNTIQQAQKLAEAKHSPSIAQSAYTNALMPYIKPKALNIALHLEGKQLDSSAFANFIANKPLIHCFIGGAYGFEAPFLNACERISLSTLTLSHKMAKLVLLEQLYRALSIIHKHPYHK